MRKVKGFLFFIALLCCANTFAQTEAAGNVQMADGMRSDGKIYVVVIAVLIILAGLLLYLISIDKKISRVEKEIEQEKK